MATKKEIEQEAKFKEKYEFIPFEHNEGEYKDVEFKFLLLTKEEKEELMKKTYNRMKLYNRKYKPKEWAGYDNKHGDEI